MAVERPIRTPRKETSLGHLVKNSDKVAQIGDQVDSERTDCIQIFLYEVPSLSLIFFSPRQ